MTLLFLLGLAAIIVGLVSLVKPVKSLKINKRVHGLWVIALGLSVVVFAATRDADKLRYAETQNSTEQAPKLPAYEVLRAWEPDRNPRAIGRDLLVSGEVTEDELVALIKAITDGYDPAIVRVVTSARAFEYLMDSSLDTPDYAREEYILYYMKDHSKGFNELRWFQESGPFAEKFGTTTQLH